MRTYTWTYEGNEKKLDIYPNFLRYENQVFMDGEYKMIEQTATNQLLFRDSRMEPPMFEISFETETQAKEALDLLIRTWYPADFEEEEELRDTVRELLREELEVIVEEGRKTVRRACRNTCGQVADFGKFVVGRSFQMANQLGTAAVESVRAWWAGPEAAFVAREHAE